MLLTYSHVLGQKTLETYLGSELDPKSTIMVRFPDGRRETKIIPCTSQFMVSFKTIKLALNSFGIHAPYGKAY